LGIGRRKPKPSLGAKREKTSSSEALKGRQNVAGDRPKRARREPPAGATVSDYRYVWRGLAIVQEREWDDNTLLREFFPQGERHGGSTVYLYGRDHLGSVVQVWAAADGSLAAHYEYEPYGRRTVQKGSNLTPMGFTGHFTLQVGANAGEDIVLAPYRAYDPELGRWISRDPIKEDGGVNLYAYVENNPVNFTDSTGLIIDTSELSGEEQFIFALNRLRLMQGSGEAKALFEALDRPGFTVHIRSGNNCVTDAVDRNAGKVQSDGTPGSGSKIINVMLDFNMRNYNALSPFAETMTHELYHAVRFSNGLIIDSSGSSYDFRIVYYDGTITYYPAYGYLYNVPIEFYVIDDGGERLVSTVVGAVAREEAAAIKLTNQVGEEMTASGAGGWPMRPCSHHQEHRPGHYYPNRDGCMVTRAASFYVK
jgi:RHS repeat-associated protein